MKLAFLAGALLLGQPMPYETFDALPQQTVSLPGGTLRVAFAKGAELPRDPVMAWVRMCAQTVAKYYGRFPVAEARLLIVPVEGDRVTHGASWGGHGAATRVAVGTGVTPEKLGRDWILTHELIHLAMPDLADDQQWFEEGLATYVEPAARAAAGHLTAAEVWREWLDNMPKGLPDAGDRGLDRTHTWARTYWGGALFCLLADVEIRKRTHNRKGLRDALRGVVAAGGSIEKDWKIGQVLRTGDQATGAGVLMELYGKMANDPWAPDLGALWRQLGVSRDGDTVRFDDHAPLAAIRVAITNP